MAEIKIEKKKPIWPWVLGGLILLMVVGFFLFSDNDNTRDRESAYTNEANGSGDVQGTVDEDRTTLSDRDVDANNQRNDNRQGYGDRSNGDNSEVAEFVNYVRSDMKGMNLDHQTVNQAFTRLSDATTAKAKEVGYEAENLQQAKSTINQVTDDRYETTHADNIRKTAEIISDELAGLQQSKFPDLDNEANKVKKASESINPEELAMNQDDEIKDFLNEAADLLDKMK
jgi:hypothetical protein